MTESSKPVSTRSARRMLLASSAFYLLIAFEFFYMASPFAAYFYAVYGPGLDMLQEWGLTGWMLWFFLPHIVAETKSTLINVAPKAGVLLFFAGLFGFAIGAIQVYRAKISKQGVVTKGLYRHIRHPQYTALMVASLGMLLIWPRFLVLYSTMIMVFTYVALAHVEESICADNFIDYKKYRENTGAFFPRLFTKISSPEHSGKPTRLILYSLGAIFIFLLATLIAFGIRQHAIASLYTLEEKQGIYLSVTRINENELSSIAAIARTHPDTNAALSKLTRNERFIAYVLPSQMYISEIPMTLPEGQTFGHSIPKSHDSVRYKVIYTRAEFPNKHVPETENMLYHAVNKHGLTEVHVSLKTGTVENVLPMPTQSFYPNVQVPVF